MRIKSKIEKILIAASISLILLLFINGFFVDRRKYIMKVDGIVSGKVKGSKGSIILQLKKKESLDSTKFWFSADTPTYSEIEIGDSVVKPSNSYFLFLYKKDNFKFHFVDSIEIHHW
jgi:hypothetical protein